MRFPVLIGQGSRGETAMEEHSILIADKDTNYLREISEFFTGEGYSVATTDSAVSVMCDILQKHVPVLLLGGDFDKKIGLPHLLQLLKKCNRHLAVILVSDEETLPMVRTIRQEGIFYHALRPVTPDDREEIKQAVECALKAA
jgi:DNA-binding NtrC family response regulator